MRSSAVRWFRLRSSPKRPSSAVYQQPTRPVYQQIAPWPNVCQLRLIVEAYRQMRRSFPSMHVKPHACQSHRRHHHRHHRRCKLEFCITTPILTASKLALAGPPKRGKNAKLAALRTHTATRLSLITVRTVRKVSAVGTKGYRSSPCIRLEGLPCWCVCLRRPQVGMAQFTERTQTRSVQTWAAIPGKALINQQ
jgi:hypothetical protein